MCPEPQIIARNAASAGRTGALSRSEPEARANGGVAEEDIRLGSGGEGLNVPIHDVITKSDDRDRVVRIACPAPEGVVNKYLDLFYSALQPLGFQTVPRPASSDTWLKENSSAFDVYHIHWPESLWRHARRRLGGKLRGLVGFVRFLRLLRLLRKPLIWTVHNLEAHDGCDWADRIAYRLLARHARLLICHSKWARDEVIERWHPSADVVVMFHGNYDGIYPQPCARAETVKKLDLDTERPILSCLGGTWEYKGIDVAVKALQELRGGVQLVVSVDPKEDPTPIYKLTRGVADVKVIPRLLSPQEFANVVSASEALLLPYRKITGSGMFMAAMTLSRGVVASDLPFFREMLSEHPQAGRLFEVGNASAVAQAIREYLAIPAQNRALDARRLALDCTWEAVVRPVGPAIRECL